MTLRYAVIADIVGSRTLTNRADAQRIFEAALERASEGLALLQAPYPTVGDEFQAVAYTLEDALLLTLRAQLLLPPQLQLRFGIGAGRIEEFSSGVHRQAPARGRGAESAALQDGSAWWAARAAINRAHDVQDSSNPFIRTWFMAHASVESEFSSHCQTCINAMLSLRDHSILKLSARHRRITASLLLGKTQVEIARVEKLSQQAISDFARGTGAGLIQSSLIIAEAARA
nr:SatD family protein [Schaalia odontolytica]